MPIAASPEIEAVARRILATWHKRDLEVLQNLFSSSDALRVVGFDVDERWKGLKEFLDVFKAQTGEMPDWRIETNHVEAFEDGSLGWAVLYSTIVTPEAARPMRHTAVFRLERGTWRVVQWHNSLPVPNQQVFGVPLTTTLDHLVNSVLDNGSDLSSEAGSEGTMTLVFTDIVDSTVLAQSVGDAKWTQIIHSHEAMIKRVTTSHGGTVVKLLGDGSMLAFESARAAIRAAVELQRECVGQPFAVRIGIHTGEVVRTTDDLFGLTVNKAARVAMSAERGGIVASSTTRDLAGSIDGIRMGEPRIVALKGLSDTHQIFPIIWD